MPSTPPRIMFDNLLADGSVSASTFIPPYSVDNIISSLTYNYWQFNSLSAELVANLGALGFSNCVCLYGSGLIGTTITVYGSENNADFVEISSQALTRNGAHMIFFDSVAYSFYKIVFTRVSEAVTTIRNLMIGQYIEFEKCLMQSHAPAPYQRKTEYLAGKNGDGQFLGRVQSRQRIQGNYNFSMISASWARSDFQNFVNTIINETFYLAWNAGLYPQEVIFGWVDDNVPIKYTGDGNLMASSFKVEGVAVL